MFIIFPYWYLHIASHCPCPPFLIFFLMLTASTDDVLTCFLVNFWVFISNIFIVFRSSQFACRVFLLCYWQSRTDELLFSSVLLMFLLFRLLPCVGLRCNFICFSLSFFFFIDEFIPENFWNLYLAFYLLQYLGVQ